MIEARRPLLITLGIVLIIYFIYQGRFFIFGPSINITSPQNGSRLSSPVVNIEGTANNAAWLSLNDSPIYTDLKGHFSEKLIVATGTSIIGVKARDHFGREIDKYIKVTY